MTTPKPSELPARWRELLNEYEPEGDAYLSTLDCINELTASLATHPVTGWRPIETAPKDGTMIDLWFAGDAWNWRMPGFVWRPGVNFWHNEITHQSYNDGPGVTHWRPLPPAPDPA